MKNLKKNTATVALVALISGAPLAAFATTDFNTPTGSLLSDPRTPNNEEYKPAEVTTERSGSMIGNLRGDAGDVYEPAEVVDNVDSSMIEDGPGRS